MRERKGEREGQDCGRAREREGEKEGAMELGQGRERRKVCL